MWLVVVTRRSTLSNDLADRFFKKRYKDESLILLIKISSSVLRYLSAETKKKGDESHISFFYWIFLALALPFFIWQMQEPRQVSAW